MRNYIPIILACALVSAPTHANGLGENYSWQFQTQADRANRAFIEDMRQKRNSGYYAPPVYNTTIERQYNCNVSSTSTGNSGTNSTLAATPSTGGNSGSALGNNSQTAVDQAGLTATANLTEEQNNKGRVETNVRGNVSSNVEDNTTWQALNSDQQNTGNQTASIDSSTACAFGLLN
jgi:predicted DNA-binding WGR domain protein